jgi:transposase-like protein
MSKRKIYLPVVREAAIMAVIDGKVYREAANEFDVEESTLRGWVRTRRRELVAQRLGLEMATNALVELGRVGR